jgi:cation:H+ antiporter
MAGATILMILASALAWLLNPASPELGRLTGLIFLALLLVYLALSIKWGKRHPASEPFVDQTKEAVNQTKAEPMAALVLLCIGGILLVLFSSRIFVGSIIVLSVKHWHIPKIIVAATIVSIGTSLPEMVVSLTGIYKGHAEVLVGNVVGANIMNLLFVVGTSSLAARLSLLTDSGAHPSIFLWLHLPAMLLAVALFSAFALAAAKHGRFSRAVGWPLLLLYGVYLTLQLLAG